jgi:RNA polymerase sigma-70 factor, ECF subfamily
VKTYGKEALLVQFITDYKENIYRLAYSYLNNKEDALDAVQEAIYKAMKSQFSLKDPDAVKSWFYRIVVNTALDLLRKRQKVQPMDDGTLNLFLSGSEDVYPDIDLETALGELPEKYRSVIILRYFEDLKIEEVAEILNENVNTIKTRLYQAIKFLKVSMKDMEGV